MLKVLLGFYFATCFLLVNGQKKCQNGGVLTNLGGLDYCVCSKDYFGDFCEKVLAKLTQNDKDRLGCALKPCWFGSTCEDLTHLNGTFKCHCNAVSFFFFVFFFF